VPTTLFVSLLLTEISDYLGALRCNALSRFRARLDVLAALERVLLSQHKGRGGQTDSLAHCSCVAINDGRNAALASVEIYLSMSTTFNMIMMIMMIVDAVQGW